MARSIKRFIRFVILASLSLALLSFAALYCFRVELAHRAISTFLARQQLEGFQFEIKDISLQQFSVNSFSGCFGLPASTRYCLKSGPATLYYSVAIDGSTRMERLKGDSIELRVIPADVEAASDHLKVSALAKRIELKRFIDWIAALAVTGIVKVEGRSAFPPVAIKANSQCTSVVCNFEFEAGSGEFEYSLRLKGSESDDGTLSLTGDLFREQAQEGTIVILRETATGATAVKAMLKSPLVSTLVPESARKKDTTESEFSDVNVSLTVSGTGDSSEEIANGVTVTSGAFPFMYLPLSKIDLAGVLTDDFSLFLRGTLKANALVDTIKVEQFERSPDGKLKGRFGFTASAKEAAGMYRSISDAKLPFGTRSGNLKGSYKFDFDDRGLRGEGSVSLHSLALTAGKVDIDGVKTTLSATNSGSAFLIKPALISFAALNAGVALTDGEIQLAQTAISGPIIQSGVKHAKAKVFGGTLQSDTIHFQNTQKKFFGQLRLEGLDIAKIIALYGKDVVKATGIVDGKLPLTYEPGHGFSVLNGSLTARENGGVIQIGDDLAAKLSGTPGMDVAARALQDYRYTFLKSSVTYEPDGRLLLGLELQGKSPRLNTSRPVHVNLNVEQNVLKLLKSLSIVEQIEAGLRK